MKVLLVENDLQLADRLTHALRRAGYTVVRATDGEQALQRWEAEQPDFVVLNVTLPKLDGLEVCRRIRQQATTPIILLTALDAEDDAVRGLQLGADDYVTQPVSTRELTARMRVVLRRHRRPPPPPPRAVRVGDLVLDLQAYQATRAGTPIHLTRTEFRILWLLAANAGQVIPYPRLVRFAWGYRAEGAAGRLKSYITHIRQKLNWPSTGAAGTGGISAVPGVGYRLTPPGHASGRTPAA